MINVGDIYESCSFHAVLCTEVQNDGDVMGISLCDGTYGHGCSPEHCGVRKLTAIEALAHHQHWTENRSTEEPSEYWKVVYDECFGEEQ